MPLGEIFGPDKTNVKGRQVERLLTLPKSQIKIKKYKGLMF